MKRSLVIAAIISILTACIGIGLWVNEFPPEKEGLSEFAQQARRVITFPLFWALFGLVTTVPLVWFKKERLAAPAGKASLIPAVFVQSPAIVSLIFQILIPLDFYDVIGTAETHLIFFYFISALFFLMGNYIATAPFGSRIGFRTKATLSDQIIWVRTHRFLGRSLVMTALVTLPVPLILYGQTAQWSLIGLVVIIKAITWIYARQLGSRFRLRNSATN